MAKRLADIPSPIEEVIYNFFVVQVVEEHTYTIAIGAAQLSLLALYWRLFKDISDLKWGVLFLVACTSIWIIVRVSDEQHIQFSCYDITRFVHLLTHWVLIHLVFHYNFSMFPTGISMGQVDRGRDMHY